MKKTHTSWRSTLLVLPGFFWLACLSFLPLCMILITSFMTRGIYGQVIPIFTFENYLRFFDPLYFNIVLGSLKLAVITTISCAVLGYPVAFFIWRRSPEHQKLLLALMIVPFCTNTVIKTYALKNFFLQLLPYFNDHTMVWLGMVTNYLPLMILPLSVSFFSLDVTILEAGFDLYASPVAVIRKIIFPLTSGGLITGSLFVFLPAFGEFIIPDILGGARTMLIGNLITEQFLKVRDWPFGSAISVLLIAMIPLNFLWSSPSKPRELP